MRKYFNDLSEKWDTIAFHDPLKLNVILENLDLKAGHRVFDMGSGTGVFLERLSKKVGPNGHIIAFDIAEQMLLISRKKHFPLKISYLQGTAESISIKDESFHRVMCYSVFPHFKEKYEVLQEIKRILYPGGILVIAHSQGREKINAIHKKIEGTISGDYLPNKEEMSLLLKQTSFTIKNIIDNDELYCYVAWK